MSAPDFSSVSVSATKMDMNPKINLLCQSCDMHQALVFFKPMSPVISAGLESVSVSWRRLGLGLASVSVGLASISLISFVVGRLRHIHVFGSLGRILGKKSPGLGAPKLLTVQVVMAFFRL